MKECKYCKGEVKSKSNNAKFCSIECRNKNDFEENQKERLNGIEGYDYVIDQWNGYATPRIFGHWFKSMHPGRTIEEYRQEFPYAKLQCDKINAKNGQFMKKEKYRKMMSEKMSGEGNPNHSSKTTKEQRQSKSPFSKKFSKYKNEEDRKKFIESVDYGSIVKSSDLEWWIDRCNGDVKQAKELYKDRQTTFTLGKCIEKHGQNEGTKIYNDRQKKWLTNLHLHFEKYGDGRSPQSKWANEIKEALRVYGFEIPVLEKWIKEKGQNGKAYSYDITIGSKIIELHGDYWHMNPNMYESGDMNKSKGMPAHEIWEYDKNKIKLAESHGYKGLTIWESDYHKNPTKTIQKCIQFLKE
jgi:hypothetical protein